MGLDCALLLVGSDAILRRALKDQLVAAGMFSVIDEASSVVDAVDMAKARAFDLILCDVDLPEDGPRAGRVLRAAGARAPIIMLTTADFGDDMGLSTGPIDIIAKPFRMATLLTRVQAHLQQHDVTGGASFAIGPYTFQPDAKVLTIDGSDQKIRLTEKETAILAYLHRVGNKTVPRETLLDEVWGYNAGVTTHTLETHVYRLRQKIEPDPQQIQLLVTEPGGYRLNP